MFHDVQPLPELAELREAVYVGGKKVFSHDYLKRLTPLSLALWYQDDASFTVRAKGVQARTADGSGRAEICIEAMDPGTRQRLWTTWGTPGASTRGSSSKGAAGKAVLVFPKDETAKLHALIAPFVHPSMDYKLLPDLPGPVRGRARVRPGAQRACRPAHHGDQRQAPHPVACIASTSRSRARTTTSSTG